MPRHGITQAEGVAFDFTDFQSWYSPGDTVLGHVVTTRAFFEGLDVSKTTVQLRLSARAETRYASSGRLSGSDAGNAAAPHHASTVYRGRAVLFEQSNSLHAGPLLGDARLPFSVVIPETSKSGTESSADYWEQEKDAWDTPTSGAHRTPRIFLGSTQQEMDQHPTPSVYYARFEELNASFEAYIEYVLEATMACPGTESITIVAPLLVRSRATSRPIRDKEYDFAISETPHTTRSEVLLPENSERRMTFREKSRRLFPPYKTPRYTYTVKVVHPRCIQLDHPDPVPFKVYLVPALKDGKTTICPDGDLTHLPDVECVALSLKLKSATRLRVKRNGADYVLAHKTEYPLLFAESLGTHSFKIPLVVRGNVRDTAPSNHTTGGILRGQPSEAGTGPRSSDQSSLRPIDEAVPVPKMHIDYSRFAPNAEGAFFKGVPFALGEHVDVRVSRARCSAFGAAATSSFRQLLYPSFATYNICLTHQLSWKLKLVCAGESHTVSGRADVQVLLPSEEEEARRRSQLGAEGMAKDYDQALEALGLRH